MVRVEPDQPFGRHFDFQDVVAVLNADDHGSSVTRDDFVRIIVRPGVQCRQPAGVAGLPSFVTIGAENAPIAAQRRCQRSGRMPIEFQPVFRGDLAMWTLDQHAVPHIQTPLPGPRAQKLLDRDALFVSPSYTRSIRSWSPAAPGR